MKTLIIFMIPVLFFSFVNCKQDDTDKSNSSGSSVSVKTPENRAQINKLKQTIKKLAPLHKKLGKPGPNDWLATQKESGQTFEQYLKFNPVIPAKPRNVLYLQPLGDFTVNQQKILETSAEFARIFFNITVIIKEKLPDSVIPKSARRIHRGGNLQYYTKYILYDILKPNLPSDAAFIIAITATDLYPDPDWNFVFGQASLKDRVGVQSIYRNGEPDENDQEYQLCLLRTLKTLVHETGHMFSVLHCIKYECLMCGSMNRKESDSRPIWLCPECLAKICFATKSDPIKRYEKLLEFYKQNKFKTESEFTEESFKALKE